MGFNQLHEKVRNDERVISLEKTNVKSLTRDRISQVVGDESFTGFDVIVCDVSFISLTSVLPTIVNELSKFGTALFLLVKPQFEVGVKFVSRGKGVIRDPLLWKEALKKVSLTLEELSVGLLDIVVSPIKGPKGNVEFIMYCGVGEKSEINVDSKFNDLF